MTNQIGSSINEHWARLSGYVKTEAKPSNIALWLVLLFANLVFLLLDAVTGWTVYGFTSVWQYGVMAFLAGCVPFWLAEAAFVRAYASTAQKWLAGVSAFLAIVEIMASASISAIILISYDILHLQTYQIVLVAVIIGFVIAQAILALGYFYVDEEIRENQKLKQGLAGIERTHKRGQKVLDGLALEEQVMEREREIENKVRERENP